MMLPTHVVIGIILGLGASALVPEFGGVLLVGAVVGSILPDLDMYFGHRKTLHYPTYFPVLAGFAVLVAIAVPTTATVGSATVLVAAAVHSISDIFGGGLELRPWRATSTRGVYDHRRGRWIAPRRWIPYDGAPRDLGVTLLLGLPVAVIASEPLNWFVGATLIVAIGYTAIRRRLPELAEYLLDLLFDRVLPAEFVARLPARYRKEHLLTGN